MPSGLTRCSISIKKAIQTNHEFLADEAVIANSSNVQSYQKLLLKMQSGDPELQLASSIKYSLTKKRIIMMTKPPRFRMICKQLALVPILAGLVFAFSIRTVSAQNVDQMSLTELIDAVNQRLESTESLSAEEQEKLQALRAKIQEKFMPEPPPPPKPDVPALPHSIQDRNILSIKIISKGMVMVENSVTDADEIKGVVKEFISNNGSNPKLSESPGQAYISIEKLRELPQKQYRKISEEIEQAYTEIRNKAALAEFGVKFTELKNNSEELTKIEEQYSKNFLIYSNSQNYLRHPSRVKLPPPPQPAAIRINNYYRNHPKIAKSDSIDSQP